MTNEETSPIDSKASTSTDQDVSQEVARLTQELADLKDRYVRTYADMENMRRRQEREKSDLIKYALEQSFKDFLPVLDSLEKALPDADQGTPPNGGGSQGAQHAQAAHLAHVEGMMMVKRQLLDVFKKHGLETINAQGAAFDPNMHQAIQRVESAEVQVETVGNEFARGYILNGRLLRPAMVSVLTPPGA